jgi:hypothetical protein
MKGFVDGLVVDYEQYQQSQQLELAGLCLSTRYSDKSI